MFSLVTPPRKLLKPRKRERRLDPRGQHGQGLDRPAAVECVLLLRSPESHFTGGHLLHLATAGCVLNDLYREAAALAIELKGVRVIAAGGFDTATCRSTGIDYSLEVSSEAPAEQLAHLLEVVDQAAEIPRAIRAGSTVRRVS